MGQGVGALKRGGGCWNPLTSYAFSSLIKGKYTFLSFAGYFFFEIDNLEVLDLLLHDQA